MAFETFVARRFLKIRNQRRLVPLINILATSGVGVGVMVLIVVIAVMTGFQSELRRRIIGVEAHIHIGRFNTLISDYEQVLKTIDAQPSVASSAAYVNSQGMLRSAAGVSAVVLKGLDPDRTLLQIDALEEQAPARLLRMVSAGQPALPIVLGKVLADKLKMEVGDGVMLMLVGPRQSNGLPGMQRLKLVGLYDTGMHQFDGVMGFMNMHHLQRVMGIGDMATGIEVRVTNPDHAAGIGHQIKVVLGDAYWANNWQSAHRNLFSMLALQKILMYVILSLIIIVAAFNIVSALIMMVKDKVRDIAILKVMGADRGSVQRIFLGKGIVIGLTGVFLGCCAGLGVCFILAHYPFVELPGNVYYLTTLPVKIALPDMLVIALGTLCISILASLYPAMKAARMLPVNGVRYR
ncbi:MAG: FtsX-like permease family protein [Desulfatitalea sp.]|nr:ABC transporter permease [Desulfatitalea sp.]NNK01691.1 FtsX-like permease family protein [Desulfatitalea sp.]